MASQGIAPLRRLERFVLRARIVQDHSLAADKGVLEKHAQMRITVQASVDPESGKQSLKMSAPLLPTEQVESAAARVRPMFLKSDGVHYDDVLNDLQAAADLSAKENDEVEALRALFQQADPDYPESKRNTLRSGPSTTNKELAGAWLYGHLLHDDEKRRTYSAGFTAELMLLNATNTVCREILATVQSLWLIERLASKGSLTLPERLFTEPVTVTERNATWEPELVSAHSAPVGTPMPSTIDEPLGDEWTNAAEEFRKLWDGDKT